MPCSQGEGYFGPSNADILRTKVLGLEKRVLGLKADNTILKKDKTSLEAMLCGILSELGKEKYAMNMSEFIQQVDEYGQCDVTAFWVKHQKEDEIRLMESLQRTYSQHEIELIAKLLKGEVL